MRTGLGGLDGLKAGASRGAPAKRQRRSSGSVYRGAGKSVLLYLRANLTGDERHDIAVPGAHPDFPQRTDRTSSSTRNSGRAIAASASTSCRCYAAKTTGSGRFSSEGIYTMNRLAHLAAAGSLLALQATSALASDHADPIDNPLMFWETTPLEGGITDLFVFPTRDKQQLVVVLSVRRSLTGKPAKLDQFEYVVHMDLKGTVSHDNAHFNARYGGTVVKPEDIKETTKITYRLKGDGEIRELPTITGDTAPVRPGDIQAWGGEDPRQPRKVQTIKTGMDANGMLEKNEYSADTAVDDTKVNIWTGISDDPFIFPNFFRTNVVAMVARIPMKYFPEGQMNWIVWGDIEQERKADRSCGPVAADAEPASSRAA